ncbi:hypothetical protein RJ641_024043, partial [Dillenia turbinata]
NQSAPRPFQVPHTDTQLHKNQTLLRRRRRSSGEKSGTGSLLIGEQIIRSPHRRMGHHKSRTNQNRAHNIPRHTSKKQEHNRQNRKHNQHHEIVNRTAENRQRLVPKEVEEKPRHHHDYEDDEGDRFDGRLNDRKLNISFHGRRVPRVDLNRSFPREMNSRFVVPGDAVGIVPYDVILPARVLGDNSKREGRRRMERRMQNARQFDGMMQ